jgi:hypothetical protein
LTVDWLLEEIENEIKILDKIKTQQKINDRLNNSGAERRIGFENDQESLYSDNVDEIEENTDYNVDFS